MVRGLSKYDISESLGESKRWLENIYGNDIKKNKEWKDFNLDKIHFSKTSRRGHFDRNGLKRDRSQWIWIGLRDINMWFGYCKKTKFGLNTPFGGVDLLCKKLGLKRTMVHELTHFIQYLQGRQYSELETTENELLFVLDRNKGMLRNLVPYEVRKKQEDLQKLYGVRWKESRIDFENELHYEIDNVCVMLRTKYQNNFQTGHKIHKVKSYF